MFAAAEGFEELQDGFAAGTFVEATVADDDFKGGLQGFAVAALGGVGAGQIEAGGVIRLVGGEFGFEFCGVGSAIGKGETGAQGIGTVGFLGVFTAQELLGFVGACQVNQDFDGVELYRLIVRLGFAGFDEQGEGCFELAGGSQNAGFLTRIALGNRWQGKAVKEFADLAFGQGAVEFIDQLALEEDLDRWNAAHAKVLG